MLVLVEPNHPSMNSSIPKRIESLSKPDKYFSEYGIGLKSQRRKWGKMGKLKILVVPEKGEGIEKIKCVSKMVGNAVIKGRENRIEGREQ